MHAVSLCPFGKASIAPFKVYRVGSLAAKKNEWKKKTRCRDARYLDSNPEHRCEPARHCFWTTHAPLAALEKGPLQTGAPFQVSSIGYVLDAGAHRTWIAPLPADTIIPSVRPRARGRRA